jgi:hypothetical protein
VTWRVRLTSMAAAVFAAAAFACSGGSPSSSDDAGSECMPVNPPTTCPSPPPSYENEIALIVATHCAGSNCHSRGGSEALHDFTTYKGIYDDHLTFANQVSLCPSSSSGMPPLGYPQPTTAQRLALVTWASVCGAPNN